MHQMEYPPSYSYQKENSKFKRCSTLEIHRLLVALHHIIRRYSVRTSKLCMGGSLYCIFVFLRKFTFHMLYIPITICAKQIQESCYEIRFQVFIFLTAVTVCTLVTNGLVTLVFRQKRHNDNLRCS